MSGVIIARRLLVDAAGVIALVPATRIVAGIIPQATALPCIGLTDIINTDRNTLKAGSVVKVTERVQITAMAATYPALKALLTQIRRACRNKLGTVGNFNGITCRLDGKGPDFDTESGIVMQSQDVLITYDETA